MGLKASLKGHTSRPGYMHTWGPRQMIGAKDSVRLVYFMENHKTGLIKVGFSGWPQLRKMTVKYEEGGEISVVSVFPGTMEDEKTLHRILADYRDHGEWFRKNDILDNWIDLAVNKQYGVIRVLLDTHKSLVSGAA